MQYPWKIPSNDEVAACRKRASQLPREASTGQKQLRALVASTFSIDLLPLLLREALDRQSLFATIEKAPFGQLETPFLGPPEADTTTPDYVVLLLALEDLLDFGQQSFEHELSQAITSRVRDLCQLILKRHPRCTILLALISDPLAACESVLDSNSPLRGQNLQQSWEGFSSQLAKENHQIVAIDWAWRARRLGMAATADARLWYLARMRLSPVGMAMMADLMAQYVAAHRGLARKVCVLDLDNTLWGGVVGENGVAGIRLGNDGVGLAFQDFQRALLKLRQSGVLLALCSKNNEPDAWEVFDKHPGMIIKREHLSAWRINWQDKAQNLRELAQQLNLGLDSFVFLDDSAIERGWVRQAEPAVLVPDVPLDPADRPLWLRSAPWFVRLHVTEADLHRSESYRSEQLRSELRNGSSDMDGFLATLEQQVRIEPLSETNLGRAEQMCQRTNQFNLTTPRYSLAELNALRQDRNYEAFTISVRDKFGDSGLTGLAILRYSPEESPPHTAEIDTLLLSCRVLGRRVEDALLWLLKHRATKRGTRQLVGKFIPTTRNQQTADFYSRHGFAQLDVNTFVLPLDPASADNRPDFPFQLEFHFDA